MPTNPLILNALKGLGFNLPPAEESRPLTEGEQVGPQTDLSPWQKGVDNAISGLVGFTKGATGLGEQGPPGPTATNMGQVLAAATPFALLERAMPEAAKAVMPMAKRSIPELVPRGMPVPVDVEGKGMMMGKYYKDAVPRLPQPMANRELAPGQGKVYPEAYLRDRNAK